MVKLTITKLYKYAFQISSNIIKTKSKRKKKKIKNASSNSNNQ